MTWIYLAVILFGCFCVSVATSKRAGSMFTNGAVFAVCCTVFYQDLFGGLEGYKAHLDEKWSDTPPILGLTLATIVAVGAVLEWQKNK